MPLLQGAEIGMTFMTFMYINERGVKDTLRKTLLQFGLHYSLQINRVSLHHVESRQKRKQQQQQQQQTDAKGSLELLLTLEGLRDNLMNVVKNLKQTTNIHDVVVLSEQQKEEKGKLN